MPESNSTPLEILLKAIAQVLDEGSIAAIATLISGHENVGQKLLIPTSGPVTGSLGNAALDKAVITRAGKFLEARDDAHMFRVLEFAPDLTEWTDATVLLERLQPEPRLVICGAGHVGAALARLAVFTGYNATLIDDRPEFVTRERFPDERIKLMTGSNWTDAVAEAIGNGHGVSVAVITRGHNEDEECMRAVMASDADYVGLIGSKRRTNIVIERLREAGIAERKLRQIHAPVGLDIGAVTPEEVAVSILAEIVAVRRGGKGESLSAWRRQS